MEQGNPSDTRTTSSLSISSLVTSDASPRNEGFTLPSINELMKPFMDSRPLNAPSMMNNYSQLSSILNIPQNLSPLTPRVLQPSPPKLSTNPPSSQHPNSITNSLFLQLNNITNSSPNHIQPPFSHSFTQQDFTVTSPRGNVPAAPSNSVSPFIVPQPQEKKRKISETTISSTSVNHNETNLSPKAVELKSPQKRKEPPAEEPIKKKELTEEELKQKEDTFQHLLHTSLQGPFVFNDSSCENLLDAYNQFHKNESARLLPQIPKRK